jgi:predicted nucleotidyltransferase
MNSIPFRARADLFSKPGPGKPSNSGADRRKIRGSGDSMSMTESPVIRVCRLLNEAGARYLIIGGQACILHGLVRTTEDVDVLVEATEDNCRRVLDGLSRLEDGAARELTPADLIENVVVKIADEVEVDVSTHAWKVTYAEALPGARRIEVAGVVIPYLGLDALIASKETYREQDVADRLRLLELKRRGY